MTRFFYPLLTVLVVVTLLAGCGFRPLYGNQESLQVSQALATVKIAQTDNPDVWKLRRNLLASLGRTPTQITPPRYLFTASIVWKEKSLIRLSDDFESRGQMTAVIDYSLVSLPNNKVLLTGQQTHSSSYNRVLSAYANTVAKKNAQRVALRLAAKGLLNRLRFYFIKNPDAPVSYEDSP